ncbi:hypothetical protein SEPCBS57363_002342 [Sporothrix epigloea]|uniref:N-acetyltransferase domain-containing protein n=1 Tax=Sporothrix epigloea TaxID=1892477 RepID=A0ABP0DIJ2_9PEZI
MLAVARPVNLAFGFPSNERDASHHMAAFMEVDLRTCPPDTLVDRINAVPALKTSAAFFTFLRANLVLLNPEMSSNVNTPILGPISDTAKKSSSSTNTTTTAKKSVTSDEVMEMDDIPPLSLGVLTEHADKVDALKLVADSIAQQRQTASRSMVFYPLNLAGLTATLGVAFQVNSNRDLGVNLSIMSGIIMAYLMTIRYFTAQYIPLAEDLKWDWILPNKDDGELDTDAEEDRIIGAKFGDELIGALVFRIVPPTTEQSAAATASTNTRKKRSPSSLNNYYMGGHGVVRAWTTILRYRRRGIGSDMLHEAIQVTHDRCGKDAKVVFAEAHANSIMVVHEMFNRPFRRAEQWAAAALDKALASQESVQQKR